ncbi:MAG: M20/M25/M40 family metallo-hydrolase [Chloroflexi bacterium]|nr:M20/M25/M40 family metallo-hydrolase [Chloroflexota bacterium]
MVFVACGGDAAQTLPPQPSPDATRTPSPQPSPDLAETPSPQPGPDVQRILEHIRVISEEIGPRIAGSPANETAIDYARDQLEGWGYDVEIQAFMPSAEQAMRLPSVTVGGAAERELPALTLSGSTAGSVAGTLVDAGTGRAADFGLQNAGMIVLVQRRDVFFIDMARRAAEAGALALLIANKEPGIFSGTLEPAASLPVVAIGQDEGEALREQLALGPVEVAIEVRTELQTANVIARPPGSACRTLSGAHLDSVPGVDGAGDNASGSAVVLELARAAADAGLTGQCFALWGAEEIGLVGSRSFVSALSSEERDELRAYYNFDISVDEGEPLVIGSEELVAAVAAAAQREGIAVETEVVDLEEPRVFSDHISFIEAGLPAVMITNPAFNRVHTPEDTLANLTPGALERIAALGFALLEASAADPAAGGLPKPVA